MNLVTITGPQGAGKDSVIKEVIKRFESSSKGDVKRALFLTTRKERPEETPGIDVLLASEKEFNDLLEKGELAYSVQTADYLVGAPWSELEKCKNLLVNITLEGAKILKEKFAKKGARVFIIALNASPVERKERMVKREPGLDAHQLDYKLANDPRNGLEQKYSEFDLVIDNPDGNFENTVNEILNAAKKFLTRPRPKLNMEKQYPKIGIGVWIMNKKGQALMMKRQGSHGSGTWAPPGGKLEMGELFLDCVKREVKEEANIKVSGVEFVSVTNDIFSADKHYVTVYVKAKKWSGTPKIMEPKKCSEIGWHNIHNLPGPQFLPVKQLFKSDFLCLCGSGKSFKNCHANKA